MRRAVRHLLLPWWLIQLATGAKSFGDNPVIGSRRLNAHGLHAARVRAAQSMAAWRRRRLTRLIGAEDATAYARDGFVAVADFLPQAHFAALRDQVLTTALPAREMVQGDAITRRIHLGPRELRALPAMRGLLRHPRWRGLIALVGADASAPIVYVQSILTRRHDAAPDPQTDLHSDTFHPTVKAWLFLTDVAEADGPFTYVPGSHRATAARLAWEQDRAMAAATLDRLSRRGSLRIAEGELAGLGLPAPVKLAVAANTLIVADTHGFHARGLSSRRATRVEIWAYGRRNPFLPWAGLDLAGLPGVAERRIPTYWWLRDRLARWWGQPWRDVGAKTPLDE